MPDLNVPLKPKASGTAGEIPAAEDLVVAELAINTADGRLFSKHTDDSVVEIAGSGATTLDELTDVDTSTVPPTAGQALVWNELDGEWQPGTVSGGGGAVDSVNGQTGVVSLGVQDMDDYSLAVSPGLVIYRFDNGLAVSTLPGTAGDWSAIPSQLRVWLNYTDADGNDAYSDALAQTPGDLWYRIDGGAWISTSWSNLGSYGSSFGFSINGVGDYNSLISVGGTFEYSYVSPESAPLADGDILQWNDTAQKFNPVQLPDAAATRVLLGIGEYADDAAAGTGGVSSGAMYYNTTSNDYRLKT